MSWGGLLGRIEPEALLGPSERAALAPCVSAQAVAGSEFRLELSAQAFAVPQERTPPPAPAPATVVERGGRLLVEHAAFHAEIDPALAQGRLWRRQADGVGLLVTLRVAQCALLPSRGGLPVHAAGVLLDGRGWLCFGPSGAGKSTLARSARSAGLGVLSDEQVTAFCEPPSLRPSGFWGAERGAATLDPGQRGYPLAGLLQLARGPRTALVPLTPEAVFRSLLEVLLVPPHTGLWSQALARLHGLSRRVPAARLEWHPAQPPWEALRAWQTDCEAARG